MLLIISIVIWEVMMTLTVNVTVFWDVTSSSFVDGYNGFEKTPTTLIFGIEI
jgi:hypothetical protein